MRKNRKLISIISAAALLTSAIPMTSMALLDSDEKLVAKKLNVEFTEDSYKHLRDNILLFDTNNNSKIDLDDYQVIRDRINELYYEANYDTLSFAVGDNQDLDIDGDEEIDTEDYCCLLSFLQRKFDFVVNPGTELEDYAYITNYKNKTASSVTIPTEVYYNGTIYPVMEISNNAFKNMTNLKEVIIKDFRQPKWINKFNLPIGPNSEGDPITACTYVIINDYAFNGCKNLNNIYLPDHVTFSKNAFQNSGLRSHFNINDEDEICYFKSDNNKIVACGPKYNISTTSLTLKEGTTAISQDAFRGKNITSVSMPATVNFIGDGAFSECKDLVSLTHGDETITKLIRGRKNIVTRYLAAFNSTRLACDSANEEADRIVAIIKSNIGCEGDEELTPDQQRAAVKELGKYFYTNVYYRGYSRHGVFTTDRYNVEDYDRGSIYNACGGFLLPSIVCRGFSNAASIVLDKLGIINFPAASGGDHGYGHAFNIAYIEDRWYYVDLSADGERENQIINGNVYEDKRDFINRLDEINFLRDMGTGWRIAVLEELQMFESSKDKQLKTVEIDFTPTTDSSAIVIDRRRSNLSSDEYAVFKDYIDAGIVRFKP